MHDLRISIQLARTALQRPSEVAENIHNVTSRQIDEIAARSPELLIQQKISAARRLLKEQLAGKK